MRTTLTLADDVAAAVERMRRERSLGMSEAVNELVRAGLASQGERSSPFRQKSHDLGPGIDFDDVAAAELIGRRRSRTLASQEPPGSVHPHLSSSRERNGRPLQNRRTLDAEAVQGAREGNPLRSANRSACSSPSRSFSSSHPALRLAVRSACSRCG
jgi:hypothetical protein